MALEWRIGFPPLTANSHDGNLRHLLKYSDITNVAGTTHPLSDDDNPSLFTQSASPTVINVPLDATHAMEVGRIFSIVWWGAGTVTIAADAGVTLNGVLDGSAAISARYSNVALQYLDNDVWWIGGDHGGVS